MSTVTITNTQWDTLTLQVRQGDKQDADANPQVCNELLARGQSKTFNFMLFLFYRRDGNPDVPNGKFTSWTRCSSDETITNP